MRDTNTSSTLTARLARLAMAAAGAAALTAGILACASGTPSAPEGTEIPVTYEYITRNTDSGDFDAIIHATVLDQESDVPQVGVGVYFRVTGGPGQFTNVGPVVTDDDGRAQSVLLGRGALPANKVSIEVSSGPTIAKLDIDVNGGFSETNDPPEASFTLTPNPPRAGQTTTVDVSGSSSGCSGDEPDTWTVDWGDGTPVDDGRFEDTTDATHSYGSGTAGQTFTITVTVEDCTGIEDQATRTVTVS